MRLANLHPKWTTLQGWAHASKFYVGIRFDCPHCGKPMHVNFWPPIDPDALLGNLFDLPRPATAYNRSGDTFDTLTFTPSINLVGHWHGFIVDGAIQPTPY